MFFVALIVLALLSVSSSFSTHRFSRSSTKRSCAVKDSNPDYVLDDTFDSKLPSFLLKGKAIDRPDPDLAKNLRQRFKQIATTKRTAAAVLKSTNTELAAELEELADELLETTEKFVAAAETWDAWGRPSPDLASDLRAKAELGKRGTSSDPNFVAHLPDLMKQGASDDRPAPDLPSELRMLKYKNSASVKRLAASELKKVNNNSELAAELEEIADEIEESHLRFVELSNTLRAHDQSVKSVSKR
jgi:hypothetical protein